VIEARARDERGRFLPAARQLPAREVRDPTAATQQVAYMGRDAPMLPDWDAGAAIRFGYMANVIAFRCVQLRARAIAALPIRTGPDPTDRTKVTPDSALARLLGPPPRGPAPKLSARKLIAWSIAQKIITGRFAWELELDDRGVPIYFWPLVCENLKAIPTTSGSEWFRAFTYGRADKPKQLSPDQVFYDWTPSQSDFRQPESALQAARYDLSIAVMGDRYSHAFLKNGAVPAQMVIAQQPPTPEHQDRFERNWQADYQGPDNAGRTGFQYVKEVPEDGDVGKLLAVKTLGVSQKDAQFIEQHKESLQHVAIGLGTPWSKLDASGRTFDNAKQEDLDWWNDTNLPDMTDLEDQINLELAPRLGGELMWFDTSGVKALQTKLEPASARVGAPSLVQAQIMKINEARADYGLPPDPDGDRFMTPEEIAALNPKASDPTLARAVPVVEVREVEPGPESQPPGPGPDDERQAEEDRAAAIELRRARIWSKADAQVRTLERRWLRSMQRLFARQAKSADRLLHGKRAHKALTRAPGDDPAPQFDPAHIFNPEYWADQTAETTADLYEGVAAHGFARVSDVFGVDFDLEAPYAQDFVQNRANQLAGQVTDTTYKAIQDVLSAAVENGDDLDTISQAVADVFEAASGARATTIARTEVISAFNGSASLAAAQLPEDVVGGQEWIATRDGRTRDTHAMADGQVVGIGEAFNVGGAELAYPGDPNGDAGETVNCRCTQAFLTPDEMAERAKLIEWRVPLAQARLALRMIQPGEFDERRFIRAVREAAA
jgi:HK97 family phage portal protein